MSWKAQSNSYSLFQTFFSRTIVVGLKAILKLDVLLNPWNIYRGPLPLHNALEICNTLAPSMFTYFVNKGIENPLLEVDTLPTWLSIDVTLKGEDLKK